MHLSTSRRSFQVPTPEPTPEPTPAPSPVPSPLPSPVPTPLPSALDTISMEVSIDFSVGYPDVVTANLLMPVLVGRLSGADPMEPGTVRHWTSTYSRRRRLADEDLSNSPARFLGTTTCSFSIVGSLASMGFADASSYETSLQSDLQSAVNNGELTSNLQSACNCTDIEAVSVAVTPKKNYPTLLPSSVPTPEPSHVPTVLCVAGQVFDGTCMALATRRKQVP